MALKNLQSGATVGCEITIDHTKISANENNYVLYIDMSHLPVGLHNALASDANVLKIFDQSSEAALDREIVSYSAVGDTGQLYTRVPSVSTAADVVIELYDSTSSVANQATTWTSAGFIRVYHSEESSGNLVDSCGNVNGTATNATYSQTGKFGNCLDYTDNTSITCGEPTWGSNDVYVSAWVTCDVAAAYDRISDFYTSNKGWILMFNGTNNAIGFYINGSSYGTTISFSATSTFTHFAGTYNHSQIEVYKNGTASGSPYSYTSNIAQPTAGTNIGIGYSAIATRYWDGKIDEVRIGTTVHNPTTEYNNTNSPSTFYSVSAAQTLGNVALFQYYHNQARV